MTIHQALTEASQGDARRAGERDRLILEARRSRSARRAPVVPRAPERRRLAGLIFRRTTV